MKYPKLVFLILILVSIFFATFQYVTISNDNKESVEVVGNLYIERIQYHIFKAAEPTEILEAGIKLQGGELTQEEFDYLANAFYNSDYVRAITYAPKGVNEYVYPYEENEAAIGHDVLNDDVSRIDAEKAIEMKEIVASGPYELVQGGTGIVLRNPIFIDNGSGEEFWGFTAGVMDPIKLLEISINADSLEELGYKFSIYSNYNDSNILLMETENFNLEEAVSLEFTINGNKWALNIYNEKINMERNIDVMGIFFISFFLSVFIYMGLRHYQKKHEMVKTQIYIEPLTKLYNRKYIDEYTLKEKNYILIYIDLNDFKPVNDNYGHEMGDKILIDFSKRLVNSFRDDAKLARIGGDEFVIILENINGNKGIEPIIARIYDASVKEFVYEEVKINISASIGVASFPKDGSNIKELLAVADEKMYADKKEKKKITDL